MSGKSEDTRRLLKAFGVAVTDFEDACDDLTARLGRSKASPGGAAAVLRELLELVAETNEKWQRVTDRLFETQRQLFSQVAEALPE